MSVESRGLGEGVGPEAYEAIFENSLDAVMFTVPDGRVLAANPAACALLGLGEDEVIRLGRLGLVDMSDDRWIAAVAERARSGRVRAEVPFRRADGSSFVADLTSVRFYTSQGEERACVIFRDVSERAALLERQARLLAELEQLAVLDDLTGLRNRRGFLAAAAEVLAIADRQRAAIEVLFIDLDGLKDINDRHGHHAGDVALASVARAIRDSIRSVDVAARLGGDEFVVLAFDTNRSAGRVIADRIRSELAGRSGLPFPVRVTIGSASRYRGRAETIEDLLAASDADMYRQKPAS